MTKSIETQTVGDVVARDYRASAVFDKYGIDFCCGGKIPVAEACRERGIEVADLQREIEAALAGQTQQSHDFDNWDLPVLADYIVNTHHVYLKQYTSVIAAYAQKIAEVHGANHPEVVEIADIFDKIAADMGEHLRQEEEILFPAIRKVIAMKNEGFTGGKEIDSLREIIATLTGEHDEIGEAVHAIRDLSNYYTVPEGVCNTFMVTYRKLKEFEDDLHKHVHLENNILFPKAAKL